MIKGYYSPSDEDLVEEMMSKLPPHDRDNEHRFHAMQALTCLRALGYDINIEVEVHGSIENAFKSLSETDDYVTATRPVRRVKT